MLKKHSNMLNKIKKIWKKIKIRIEAWWMREDV